MPRFQNGQYSQAAEVLLALCFFLFSVSRLPWSKTAFNSRRSLEKEKQLKSTRLVKQGCCVQSGSLCTVQRYLTEGLTFGLIPSC